MEARRTLLSNPRGGDFTFTGVVLIAAGAGLMIFVWKVVKNLGGNNSGHNDGAVLDDLNQAEAVETTLPAS